MAFGSKEILTRGVDQQFKKMFSIKARQVKLDHVSRRALNTINRQGLIRQIIKPGKCWLTLDRTR